MIKEPEYCLLWIDWWVTCMTKAEWASWAQFVGVVGSSVLALYFPLRSEVQRRSDESREYLNQRFALNEFKNDVVHFVGPLTNYAKDQKDLVVDDVQYGKILERIGFFDIRLHDSSAKKLLMLIRQALRSVDSYRHAVEDKKHSGDNLVNTFKVLYYSRFKPEDEGYFYARTPYHEMCSEGKGGRPGWWIKFYLKVSSFFNRDKR